MKVYNREYRKKNREKLKLLDRLKHLKAKYGMSENDYIKMLENQGGTCKFCSLAEEENGDALCVDHCHKTNKIRGLLCRTHNRALGLFQDNPKLLRKAADYLEVHHG